MASGSLVVVGQGYVGLPLAQEASRSGWSVVGFDLSAGLVASLNAGRSHVDDLTDEDIREMIGQGYRASSDPADLAEAEVIVVCVPTPLDDDGGPDLGAVEGAMRTISANLAPGTLVVLESTTYPGTTEELCLPILEEGSGLVCGESFELAYSPERVDPGSTSYGIRNTPKLVGPLGEEARRRAVAFYGSFVDSVVDLASPREAETAKLLENTFRHVNIALVNETAKFCHEMGIDIWEVIRGAGTKPFGFMKFTPGPGVGGHCIPIDPNYLSHHVRRQLGYPFRFVELAQEINSSMPRYVVDRTAEMLNERRLSVKGSRCLLLGVTYKPNIADQRESPARAVAAELRRRGAVVSFHDPYVERWELESGGLDREPSLRGAVQEADGVLRLPNHRIYHDEAARAQRRRQVDTRGASAVETARRL